MFCSSIWPDHVEILLLQVCSSENNEDICFFMTAAVAYKRVVCQFEYTCNRFRLFTPQLCQSVSVKPEVMSGYQFVWLWHNQWQTCFFTLRTKMEKYSDNYLLFHICWTQFKTIIQAFTLRIIVDVLFHRLNCEQFYSVTSCLNLRKSQFSKIVIFVTKWNTFTWTLLWGHTVIFVIFFLLCCNKIECNLFKSKALGKVLWTRGTCCFSFNCFVYVTKAQDRVSCHLYHSAGAKCQITTTHACCCQCTAEISMSGFW